MTKLVGWLFTALMGAVCITMSAILARSLFHIWKEILA